jgi:predicted MFS family arabinose efflux permease
VNPLLSADEKDVSEDSQSGYVKGRQLTKTTLVILCLCSFVSVFSMLAPSPVLVDIADNFGLSVALAGSLAGGYALARFLTGMLIGPLLDQWNRRRTLALSVGGLALSSIGATVAPNFEALIGFRIFAGFATSFLQPTVFSLLASGTPYNKRARAMGWVIGANNMATLIGIPLGAFLSGLFSWRWMFGLLSAATIVTAALIAIVKSDHPPEARDISVKIDKYWSTYRMTFQTPGAVAYLSASCLLSLFWEGWVTYMGAYFIHTFSLSTASLAPIMAGQGVGILIGAYLGGLLGETYGNKDVYLGSMVVSALLIVVLTSVPKPLWIAILLNIIVAVPIGTRFTTGIAIGTEILPSARGTVMALTSSAVNAGALMGASLGGGILAFTQSYSLIGPAFGVSSMVAFGIVLRFVKEVEN